MNDQSTAPRIQLGLERFLEDGPRMVAGRKTGLLSHPASVTSEFEHAFSVLQRTGAHLVCLFGPEHGFGGEAQDMEPVAGSTHFRGVPVHSLYGNTWESLTPRDESLADLDVLVIDLADVGSRYYTFVWTAVLCLQACHRLGVEVIVLDRPNPLGGEAIEGAVQREGYLSFVGLHPVPVRHGLTPGELVALVARRRGWQAALTVIPMRGWRRSMYADQTGLPWVLPSPNMPTLETAVVYPGGCLLEATGVSEGRGTTRPFELVGAPEISGAGLARALGDYSLEGVAFRPVVFKPGFQKHAGTACGGVQIHVTDREGFQPYRTGLALLGALKRTAGERFSWRRDPYEFVTDRPAIDLLTGSSAVRAWVDDGARPDGLNDAPAEQVAAFRQEREPHLLY